MFVHPWGFLYSHRLDGVFHSAFSIYINHFT